VGIEKVVLLRLGGGCGIISGTDGCYVGAVVGDEPNIPEQGSTVCVGSVAWQLTIHPNRNNKLFVVYLSSMVEFGRIEIRERDENVIVLEIGSHKYVTYVGGELTEWNLKYLYEELPFTNDDYSKVLEYQNERYKLWRVAPYSGKSDYQGQIRVSPKLAK
jgi:hypothetical protein